MSSEFSLELYLGSIVVLDTRYVVLNARNVANYRVCHVTYQHNISSMNLRLLIGSSFAFKFWTNQKSLIIGGNINTSYLTDSYVIFTLKMESVSKNTIVGL